jgi:hypothetical protein
LQQLFKAKAKKANAKLAPKKPKEALIYSSPAADIGTIR